jgi:hypothetical protein
MRLNNIKPLTEADLNDKKVARILQNIADGIEASAKGSIVGTVSNAYKSLVGKNPEGIWKKAGSPIESNAIYSVMIKAGIPQDIVNKAFKVSRIQYGTNAAPTKTDVGVISTGNIALDAFVNDLVSKYGKEYAIQYLQNLKRSKPSTKSTAQSQNAGKNQIAYKASDGQTYKLSVGKMGDRLWVNAQTGAEASDEIDQELEKAEAAKAAAPRKVLGL